jgi:hypothetical protein
LVISLPDRVLWLRAQTRSRSRCVNNYRPESAGINYREKRDEPKTLAQTQIPRLGDGRIFRRIG